MTVQYMRHLKYIDNTILHKMKVFCSYSSNSGLFSLLLCLFSFVFSFLVACLVLYKHLWLSFYCSKKNMLLRIWLIERATCIEWDHEAIYGSYHYSLHLFKCKCMFISFMMNMRENKNIA